MIRTYRTPLIILLITLLLAVGAYSARKVEIGDKDSGKMIDLKKGDLLDVVLRENPTTGYGWDVISKVEPCLKKHGGPDYKADNKMVGSGGRITFHYIASAKGKTQLKLAYKRSWEKFPPIKTYKVNVRIR